jgi:Spy/CpxP family protein refolding chaperone
MTEQDTTTTNPTEQKNGRCQQHSDRHCHGKRRVGRFIGLLAILGIGFMAGKSFGFEHGWCHDRAADFASAKSIDPEQISKMAEKRIDHMLSKVDASKEQKAKAAEIVKKSVLNGAPLAEQMRGNHEKILTLLKAKEIDKAAIEQLRIDQSKTMDDISKQMTQTILAIAELLTPEQRAKLVDDINRHGDWMHN